jgi:hypothetical protein
MTPGAVVSTSISPAASGICRFREGVMGARWPCGDPGLFAAAWLPGRPIRLGLPGWLGPGLYGPPGLRAPRLPPGEPGGASRLSPRRSGEAEGLPGWWGSLPPPRCGFGGLPGPSRGNASGLCSGASGPGRGRVKDAPGALAAGGPDLEGGCELVEVAAEEAGTAGSSGRGPGEVSGPSAVVRGDVIEGARRAGSGAPAPPSGDASLGGMRSGLVLRPEACEVDAAEASGAGRE